MISTTLFDALKRAHVIACGGYDIDGQVFNEPGIVRLDCGDDTIATLADQPIQIDCYGSASAKDVEGNPVFFEFKVIVPIRECDFEVGA